MKFRIPLAIAALTVTGVLVGPASPVSAAPGDTTTTFSLTGGAVTVAVGGTAALTNKATGVAAQTITGTLGAVTVTDARGGAAVWVASASSTAFTGAGSTSTGVNYTGGEVTSTGVITVTAGTQKTLTEAPVSVVAPSALSGNNTASWNPTLDVAMPAGALAGAYSGTVTTSVV